MSDIRKKAVRGISFLGLSKSGGKIISFINTLILARLLTPEDYGIMGMAMVVVGLIGFFNEIGLGSALVQRKEVSQTQFSSAFYLSLVISSLLYLLVYTFSGAASDFYDNQLVGEILNYLAISFIIGATATVPYSILRRELRFAPISVVEFVSILAQCAVTLIAAIFESGVWSLVYGFLTAQVLRAASYFWLAQWRPTKMFSFAQSKPLLTFGLSVTYSRITWYIYTSIDVLIIGKLLNERLLGIYSMAMSIATLPTSNITSLVISVASPLFAKLQDQISELTIALYKMTFGIAIFSFPILAGLIITAPELVPILLGDQWLEVTPILQILAGVGFFKSIDPLLTQLLISTGNTGSTARYTTLCAITIPTAIFLGANQYGLVGAALGWLVSYPLLFAWLTIMIKRKVNINMLGYFQQLITPVTATLFMIATIYLSSELVQLWWQPNSILLLTLKVVTGVLSYLFWLTTIRTEAVDQLKIVLIDLGVSEKKLDRWPFNKEIKESVG